MVKMDKMLLTRHEIQAGHIANIGLGGRDVARRSGTVAAGILDIALGRMGLEVGILARVEIVELGVGEESKVVLHVESVLGGSSGVLRTNGVEVAKVLRHVGAVPSAVCRHYGVMLGQKQSPNLISSVGVLQKLNIKQLLVRGELESMLSMRGLWMYSD